MVTGGEGYDWFASWSPDGRWIAFERQTRDGGAMVMRVATAPASDGAAVRTPERVSPAGGMARYPVWSPLIDLPLRGVWLIAAGAGLLALVSGLSRRGDPAA